MKRSRLDVGYAKHDWLASDLPAGVQFVGNGW